MERVRFLVASVLVAFVAHSLQAAISVGPSGAGPFAFNTNPIVSEFATTVLNGVGRTFSNAASVEAVIANFDLATYSPAFRELPTSTSIPPSTFSGGFRYNNNATSGRFLQSRPGTDGTNAANLLLATLRNDSGVNWSTLAVSYDFAGTASLGLADELPGFHVFYSFTGGAGSWQPVPELTASEQVANQLGVLNLGSWPAGSLLYLLWFDDNDDGDTDPGYTIDNVRFGRADFFVNIVTHPRNVTNLVNRTVSLSVVAEGLGLQYQWQKVGVGPIDPTVNPSAATSTLVITNAQFSDTGDYFVIVSNPGGAVPSNNGHIHILPDIYPPKLVAAQPSALGPNFFELKVDELLCTNVLECGANATCTFNWGIYPLDNFGVEQADLVVEQITVSGTNFTFRTSNPHTPGTKYRIKVNGDCDGGINDVFGNQLAAFSPGSTIDTLPFTSFTASKDAEIHSNAGADTPFGQATTVGVDNDDAGIAQGLLQFENLFGGGPGQIPSGSTIVSAKLRLNQVDGGIAAEFHRMLVPWDESTVTWNSLGNGVTADGVEAVVSIDATSPNAAPNGIVEIDVTSSVQAWANGAPNHGWALLSTGTDGWEWESSESASPPTLAVVIGHRPDFCFPEITRHPPSSINVNEGTPLLISASFTHGPCPPSFQWTKDGVPIPGANSDSFSKAAAVAGPQGDSGTYRVTVTADGITITSSNSVVTVVPETSRPSVTQVTTLGLSTISASFNEAVSAASATNLGNYSVLGTPSVTVDSVALTADRRTVTLTTTARSLGGDYSLRIENVTDSAATPNSINPNPTVVPLTTVQVIDGWSSTWSYNTNNQDATLAGIPWYSPAFNANGWPTGNGLFGIETSANIVALFPTPIATPLPPNTNTPPGMVTFYFRREITLPPIPANATYALNHFIDDGAVFWLDGVEIGRLNITNSHPVLYAHRASTAGEAALLSLPFMASPGTHTLAVEVHQGGATSSSDVLFGAQIIALSHAPRLNITGSRTNSVVTWSADSSWTLERANVLAGPYVTVNPTSGFGVHTNVTAGNATNLFFRLRYQP